MNKIEKQDIVKSPIISCSRRTDIPAFLMNWIIQRMKEGFVEVINPFNHKQKNVVSLDPKDVKCIVWWSKNFGEWINTYNKNRDLFDSYEGHVFQFTINTPSELENNIKVSLNNRFKQLEWLVNEYGILAINYRYDPIIFYKEKSSNNISNNLGQFKPIMEEISNIGIKEMIFSFATIYSKVKNRMNARGYIPIDPSIEKKKEILNELLQICNNYDIKMKACCQPDLLGIEGVEQSHCIDAYKIEKLIGKVIPKLKDTGQRKDCGCYKSKDIGGYSGIFRCKHNCAYCYASPAKR
ncbi:MAG: DUF1848 family protein [Promethearchaeota archaeon]